MADEKIITSSVFEQGVTEIMQDIANNLYEFEEYTEEEVADLIDLSEEEVVELTRVINDTTVALNKVYSNKKVEELLAELEVTCNKYADEKIGGIANIHLVYVDSLPSLGEDNTIYILKSTTGGNDTLNLYNNGWISIGEFSISLDNYYDKTEIDALLNDKANANEVISQNDVVSDMSVISSSTVLSTAGLEVELDKKVNLDDMTTELEKKIDKTNIATILDNTVTDEQVPSAKAVYNKTSKFLKTYTSFEQLGLTSERETIENIANSMEEYTRLFTIIEGSNKTIYPSENGTLIVEKINKYRVHFKFCKDKSPLVFVGTYHRLSGFTGWQRLCITTVADTSGTATVSDGASGSVSYKVINGIAWVSVEGIASGLNGTQVCTISGLPKASVVYVNAPLENNGDRIGTIYSTDGITFAVHKTDVPSGYGSFSYPVAE